MFYIKSNKTENKGEKRDDSVNNRYVARGCIKRQGNKISYWIETEMKLPHSLLDPVTSIASTLLD